MPAMVAMDTLAGGAVFAIIALTDSAAVWWLLLMRFSMNLDLCNESYLLKIKQLAKHPYQAQEVLVFENQKLMQGSMVHS